MSSRVAQSWFLTLRFLPSSALPGPPFLVYATLGCGPDDPHELTLRSNAPGGNAVKSSHWARWLVLMIGILAGGAASVWGQSSFEVVAGKAFDAAIPKDFYLEGNAFPVEKRNAVLINTPAGTRVLFALLDTSGYSSQFQGKYLGMLIAEGRLSVGGVKVDIGSFGFGLETPPAPGNANGADAKVFLYNQAGEKLGECLANKDAHLNSPRPLQVILSEGRARLYLGRYWVELGSPKNSKQKQNAEGSKTKPLPPTYCLP